MEEFNFASERVQELIARLQGVTFFCAVAMAVKSGIDSSDKKDKSPEPDSTSSAQTQG